MKWETQFDHSVTKATWGRGNLEKATWRKYKGRGWCQRDGSLVDVVSGANFIRPYTLYHQGTYYLLGIVWASPKDMVLL